MTTATMTAEQILSATPDLSKIGFVHDTAELYATNRLWVKSNWLNLQNVGAALLIAETYKWSAIDDTYTFVNLERGKGAQVKFHSDGLVTVHRMFPRYVQLPGKAAQFVGWQISEHPDTWDGKKVDQNNEREKTKAAGAKQYFLDIKDIMPSFAAAAYILNAGIGFIAFGDADKTRINAKIVDGYRRALWAMHSLPFEDFPKPQYPARELALEEIAE